MKELKERLKETPTKTKKEIIIASIIAVVTLLFLIGGSYAYFTANVTTKNEEGNKTTITTATLVNVEMEYGEIISSEGIYPGHKVVKTIHITGEGNENSVAIPINLTLTPHVSDFPNHVRYSIYGVDNSTIDISSICGNSENQTEGGKYYDSMECDTSKLGNNLKTGIFVDEQVEKLETLVEYNTDRTYYIIIEYINETEGDQNSEQGKVFTINLGYEGEESTIAKPTPTLMAYKENTAFWQYRENITEVIFENELLPKTNASYTFDVSEAQDESVMAYLVTNENDATTYTLYIQGNGKILANSNSELLFLLFTKLTNIEGLEYFDTNNVTNMNLMFSESSSLTTLDLSTFKTHKVTSFIGMFRMASNLESLNVSSFDTSNAINMSGMFKETAISALDVSNFDTSNVTDMYQMFYNMKNLTRLDLSHFNTEKVILMGEMFEKDIKLLEVDISNFNFANVMEDSLSPLYKASNHAIFKEMSENAKIYVKDENAKNWILNVRDRNGDIIYPSSWTEDNIIIKG